MPRSVDASAAVVEVARLAADLPRTVWIGIDGFGGAGKTTLAASIATAVPRGTVVHVDDFSAPALRSWDWRRFRAQVLIPLLDGRPARYQRWDWDRDEGAEWHDIAIGSVVVLEGVSSTRDAVGAPWDLTIWVDAPRDVRLERAITRDGPAMLPRWLEDWMPSEQSYAARESPQDRVDLVVSGMACPRARPITGSMPGDSGGEAAD